MHQLKNAFKALKRFNRDWSPQFLFCQNWGISSGEGSFTLLLPTLEMFGLKKKSFLSTVFFERHFPSLFSLVRILTFLYSYQASQTLISFVSFFSLNWLTASQRVTLLGRSLRAIWASLSSSGVNDVLVVLHLPSSIGLFLSNSSINE